MPGLVVPFVTFTLLYILLSVVLVFLLRRQFLETADPGELESIITPKASKEGHSHGH